MSEYLSGTDIEEAIGAISPLVNPRLSEVDWSAVAEKLQEHVYAIVGMTANEYDALVALIPDHTECGEGRDIEIERQTARMHSYCVNDCEVGADGRRTFRNNAFEDEECIDSIHSAADGLAALARATPRPR